MAEAAARQNKSELMGVDQIMNRYWQDTKPKNMPAAKEERAEVISQFPQEEKAGNP